MKGARKKPDKTRPATTVGCTRFPKRLGSDTINRPHVRRESASAPVIHTPTNLTLAIKALTNAEVAFGERCYRAAEAYVDSALLALLRMDKLKEP